MDNSRNHSSGKRLIWLLLIIIVVLVVVYFIFFRSGSDSQSGPGSHQQATAVQVAQTSSGNVPVQVNALGTVAANQTATITSQISGELLAVHFTEGQWVKKGQLLATIDTRSYEAEEAQYIGELAENRALLRNAELTLARYRKLYAQNSLSRQDLDSEIADVGQYRGAIATDEAQIRSARVSIGYGQIRAPFSGYVGLRLTDVGNVVSAESTEIVELTQTKPSAVTFSIPEQYLAQVRPVLRSGHSLPVTVMGSDGTTKLATGTVSYLSNSIDTSTGTVELKAMFDNKDDSLFPNQYVNVVLNIGELNNVVIAPEAAIQLSDSGHFVYVVNSDNEVHRQMIEQGPTTSDNNVAVIKGLKAGDRVVTRGVDNLRDGSKVNPVQPESDSDSSNSSQSSESSSSNNNSSNSSAGGSN